MNCKRAGFQKAFWILETYLIPTRLLSDFESGSRGNCFHVSSSSGAHPPLYIRTASGSTMWGWEGSRLWDNLNRIPVPLTLPD